MLELEQYTQDLAGIRKSILAAGEALHLQRASRPVRRGPTAVDLSGKLWHSSCLRFCGIIAGMKTICILSAIAFGAEIPAIASR